MITAISSPAWSNLAQTTIDVTLATDDHGDVPCTLKSGDMFTNNFNGVLVTCDALFQRAAAGDFGAVGPFTQSQARLRGLLAYAGGQAVNFITGQIFSDATHQAAGQNAAMIVAGTGGAPGPDSPFYVAFNAYAALFGVTPAALATLAVTLTNQSLFLSAAGITLNGAAAAATTPAELATALATFETAIGGVVTAVNAVLPSPITAPPNIVIPGINA